MSKYTKVLDLLAEYTKKNSEVLNNINKESSDYKAIIWLDDFPNELILKNTDNVTSEREYKEFIELSKPRQPKEPSVYTGSEVLELWADKESLKDEYATPRIKPSIFVNGKTILSTNFPQIEKELKDYTRDKWLDDLIVYKEQVKCYEKKLSEFDNLNKVYDDLLSLNNKLEQLGEDYELVIGVGLLNVNGPLSTDYSIDIARHIFTCKAEIAIDPSQKEPIVKLSPDIENVVQIETDALFQKYEAGGMKSEDEIIEGEKEVYVFLKENNITNDIFDGKVKEAIKLFEEQTGIKDVTFSPALILRKINKGGISALCERIFKAVESGDETEEIENGIKNYELKQSTDSSLQSVDNLVTGIKEDNQIRFNNKPDLLSMSEFLVFTTNCNVYKIQNKGLNKKFQIIENVEFETGDKPIYVTGTRNYSGYVIVAYENGKIGKITMESYKTEFNRKKLKSAYNNESPLIYIEHIEEDINLVAISSINKVILFNTSQINSVGSKTTKGFHVMKSKDGSKLQRIKKPEQVKFQDPSYYRRNEGLNVVGFYLKPGDEI